MPLVRINPRRGQSTVEKGMSSLQMKSISGIGAIVGIVDRVNNGKAGLGYGMAFERAAHDPTAAPTEMMPRFAFRNERNDSDAISTAAISCVTHAAGK